MLVRAVPPEYQPVDAEEGRENRTGSPIRPANLGAGVAAVAHELRGPLTAILLAVETIPEDIGPVVGRVRTIVTRQARLAARVVDDLFDLAANCLGKLAVRHQSADLTDIIMRSVDATGHLVSAKGHRMAVSLPVRPVTFRADPLRLEQVLTNLLSNACKFTDPGGYIHLSAEADGEWVLFRVCDDGQGIPPQLLPRVFDLYSQGDDRGSGLGLGLALVKTLVELHAGSVTVSSGGTGRRAEFVVRVPVGGGS